MIYATTTDLINRLGEDEVSQLTNIDGRSDLIDEVVASSAIKDGQGLVDSYLGQRVSLPLDNPSQMLKTLSVDLAIYYLRVRLGNNEDSATAKLYDDAIKQLARFADGETSLGLSIDTSEVSTPADIAEITSCPRENSRETLGRLT